MKPSRAKAGLIAVCGGLAALAPDAGRAQAAPGHGGGSTVAIDAFLDPTENAFTAKVPHGWKVEGGITRVSFVQPVPWLSLSSPNGLTHIFIGDPSIPPRFFEPASPQDEGRAKPFGRLAAVTFLRYLPPQPFAQKFGAGKLASLCENIQPGATQPAPRFAHAAEAMLPPGSVPPVQTEGGLAQFTCTQNGQPAQAVVLADTAIIMQPPPQAPLPPDVPASLFGPRQTAFWGEFGVAGFVAPPGQANTAFQILMHVHQSMQYQPAWVAAQHQLAQEEITRQNSEGAAARAQIAEQGRQFTQILLARGEDSHRALMTQHDAFMTRFQNEARADGQFRRQLPAQGYQYAERASLHPR